MATLLKDATATGAGAALAWSGFDKARPDTVYCWGSFDGATATLQASPDGETWFDVRDAAGDPVAFAVLAIATSWLAACATGGSEPVPVVVCPPVVEYDRAFQARAAAELEGLPEDAAIVAMIVDYAVMRDQARACRGG